MSWLEPPSSAVSSSWLYLVILSQRFAFQTLASLTGCPALLFFNCVPLPVVVVVAGRVERRGKEKELVEHTALLMMMVVERVSRVDIDIWSLICKVG